MFWVATDLREGFFFFVIIQALTETLYTDHIHSHALTQVGLKLREWENKHVMNQHGHSVGAEYMRGD